jgi:hypothetical protein
MYGEPTSGLATPTYAVNVSQLAGGLAGFSRRKSMNSKTMTGPIPGRSMCAPLWGVRQVR